MLHVTLFYIKIHFRFRYIFKEAMGQISRGLNAQLWGNSGKNLQEIQKESGKKNDERQLSSI